MVATAVVIEKDSDKDSHHGCKEPEDEDVSEDEDVAVVV